MTSSASSAATTSLPRAGGRRAWSPTGPRTFGKGTRHPGPGGTRPRIVVVVRIQFRRCRRLPFSAKDRISVTAGAYRGSVVTTLIYHESYEQRREFFRRYLFGRRKCRKEKYPADHKQLKILSPPPPTVVSARIVTVNNDPFLGKDRKPGTWYTASDVTTRRTASGAREFFRHLCGRESVRFINIFFF